jgi:hypothetical protein
VPLDSVARLEKSGLNSPNGGNQRLATIRDPHRPILSQVRCIALFSLFFGLTRSRNPEVTADFLHEVIGNLTMSRHGGPLIDRRISPPRMVSTFANQLATMSHHVENKISPLHG